jgi:hypothetical protein
MANTYSELLTWDGQMTRYKGRFSSNSIERDFPHIVDVAVPPNGLGTRLNAMHDFHAHHEIHAHQTRGRHSDGRYYIRWYFAEPTIAAAFASEFKA